MESAQLKMVDLAFGKIFDAMDAERRGQTELEQGDTAKRAEEILFKQGDMHSHYDIGPWEGGYAVFRTYEIDDAMLAEYGLPTGLQKLGESETLLELHQAIIDGSALAVIPLWITDAERTRETDTAAEKDHIKADVARLRELENQRDSFVIGAPNGTETHDPDEWRLQNPKDAEELERLESGRDTEQSESHNATDDISRPLIEPMTLEAIDRDDWNAVVLDIPETPSGELLTAAKEAVARCVEEAHREMMGAAYGAALVRSDELDEIARERSDANEILQPVDGAQLKMANSAFGAIFDALDADRRGTDTAAERRDHMTDYASYVGLEISERSPLAADRTGDDISRPLSAAERNERVRRIIENPHLEGAERDDGVLQALAEQREELGLAEPARQDDAPQVEYSQEPETQSTADRDAAEVDYFFGREEMTEARAAAYDRWTGQELSPRSDQSIGPTQGAGQSRDKGRSR